MISKLAAASSSTSTTPVEDAIVPVCGERARRASTSDASRRAT